jgi:Phage tail lysozyme
MPLGPGAYIAEEIYPWVDSSGKIVPATGGKAIGQPAGGGAASATPGGSGGSPGGGAGGGGGGGPSAGAQQHHVQPTAAKAPPQPTVNILPWKEREGPSPAGSHYRPVVSRRGAATGASSAPVPKTQADPTRHLLQDVYARRAPIAGEDPGSEGREKTAVQYFRRVLQVQARGHTEHLKAFQAAALVGNMAYESRAFMRPGSPELVSTLPGGIAQWGGSRLDALRRFSPRRYEDFRVQLAFAAHELLTGGRGAIPRDTLQELLNATNIREATAIVEAAHRLPKSSLVSLSRAPASGGRARIFDSSDRQGNLLRSQTHGSSEHS